MVNEEVLESLGVPYEKWGVGFFVAGKLIHRVVEGSVISLRPHPDRTVAYKWRRTTSRDASNWDYLEEWDHRPSNAEISEAIKKDSE